MAGGSDVAETTLLCAQCGKPARLQCPKCMELKLPREGAAFCTQDCFKASWSSHKSAHLKAKLSAPGTGTAGEQNTVNEGWLYCLSKAQSRTAELPHFNWTGYFSKGSQKLNPTVSCSMLLRSRLQIRFERIRETCGVTGLLERSVNEVICHGIPDARKLEDGDIVNVDVTVYYKGVHSDLNETYFVGNVDEASCRLVQCT
ncbi:hypothetical protein SLA2020_137370 [Shorea laevis]